LVLWTMYLLAMVTALTALLVFVIGNFVAGIAASVMFWRAVALLWRICKRR